MRGFKHGDQKKIATPNRIPLNQRHKPWWQRQSTEAKPSKRRNQKSSKHKTLQIPNILVRPTDTTTTTSASSSRPKSAPRQRRRKKGNYKGTSSAVGAPPYQSGYSGRTVPCRIEHNIARGRNKAATTTAIMGTTKNKRRPRPQSASVVRRRGGITETINSNTNNNNNNKTNTNKYNSKAGVIVRRSASTMRSKPIPSSAVIKSKHQKLKQSTTSMSTSTATSISMDRHASLGGPFTRSDPRMYGGAPSPSPNPSDAAIYAVQTTPRAARLTAIEKGRNQVPLTERALTLPPKTRSSTEGHVIAASFGNQLRTIKDNIPTPAPQSLDKVAPDLQKAILWPEHVVERRNWPQTQTHIASMSDIQITGTLDRKLNKEEYVYKIGRACRLNDGACVANLLEKEGVQWINEKGSDGTTALHHAAAGGAANIVLHLLLPCGADPNVEANYVGTPLDVATQRLSKLKRSGQPQDLIEKEAAHQLLVCILQTSSIWQASRDGDLPRVQHLLEYTYNNDTVNEDDNTNNSNNSNNSNNQEEGSVAQHEVNDSNIYGMTPLHYACMGEQAHVIRYLLESGAETNISNNLGQTPFDVTNKEWVHRALEKETRERNEKITQERDRILEIESIQREEEERDRNAWSAARGTSSAVPLAARLKRHQNNAVALLHRKRDIPTIQNRNVTIDNDDDNLIDEIGAGASGAQKKGIFASARPTEHGRYLLAYPGSEHTTKALAKRAMPSNRIVDDRRTEMEGTSRLRHVRRLSHGDDTPKAVFREFWRFDARRTAKEAARQGEKERKSRKRSGHKHSKNSHSSRSSSSSSSSKMSAAPSMQKRKSLLSKRVTTKAGQGHPNTDSQAFDNWLRLHFGNNVPSSRPLQKR